MIILLLIFQLHLENFKSKIEFKIKSKKNKNIMINLDR